MTSTARTEPAAGEVSDGRVRDVPPWDALRAIERRVLWLAAAMVHHANHVRPNPSGVKVGGHQASVASMVSIMTALWWLHLEREDRVSVKPHASPALHAIEYLLGLLDRRHLTELRAFGGIQAYPSRTKDPVPADFSTGSVGIGAAAPIWAAVTERYLEARFGEGSGGRQIALVGDAELDEGAIWEALVDPVVARLGEVTWVVDVNRQSLDRVVPDIAVGRLEGMFRAAGWHVIELKYGRRLEEAMARPGGDALRRRIDLMQNEEYQRLLRHRPEHVRERFVGDGPEADAVRAAVAEVPDHELPALVRSLGGHDLEALAEAFGATDRVADRPSVIFAYTIKGYGLPIEGHPANHSALMTDGEYRELAADLGTDPDDPWRPFPEDSQEAELCRRAAERLRREPLPEREPLAVPTHLGGTHTGRLSTQQAFGRFFSDLHREGPDVARRVVTVSPDVASSTSLGGWINRVGVWSPADRRDWFEDDTNMLVRWREGREGQHIELGIAETNLVGLLGALGSAERERLLPIGTIYDTFVGRVLEPWSFALYSGARFVLVGTPSGVTLSGEGGAHQSVTTPSIGLEQPGCVAFEPVFAQEVEWVMLDSLARMARPDGEGAYVRLSTRPLDQRLAALPESAAERDRRRHEVVSGGYTLRGRDADATGARVTLVVMGVMVPEVLEAADVLAREAGLAVRVVVVTSADLLVRSWRAGQGLARGDAATIERLFPPEEAGVPLVTVLDGHPHTLAFLGAVQGSRVATLGVDAFGQSGDVDSLYRHFGIDAETIVGAALDLV